MAMKWLISTLLLTVIKNDVTSVSPMTSTMTYKENELCPYSNSCNHVTNTSIDDPDSQACCLPCSCDPFCASVDKCCHDASHALTPDRIYPCRTQKETYFSYLNLTYERYFDDHIYSFRIINACPDEAGQTPELADSVSRCYAACEIEDLVFVSGTTSGLTYLNRHCARCNGETAYSEWSLHVTDDNVLVDASSFEERDRRILSTGRVISIPTIQQFAYLAMCDNDAHDTCNQTGGWDFFDIELKTKCEARNRQGTVGYFETDTFRGIKFFANVYCFLCNQPKGTVVNGLCERIDVSSATTERSTNSVPFSGIIDTAPKQTPARQGSECGIGEVMDPFHLSCTRLYCPIWSIGLNGECVPLIDEITGYLVAITVELEFEPGVDLTSLDFVEVARDVAKVVIRKVNTRAIKCDLCNANLMEVPQSGELYATVKLGTTNSCGPTTLLHGLASLFHPVSTGGSSEEEEQLPTATVLLPKTKLRVTLTNVREYNEIATVAVGFATTKYCITALQFLYNETVTCSSIGLSHENMGSLTHHDSAFKRLASRSVKVEDRGDSLVCLADYVSMLRSSGLISGDGLSTRPMVLLILMTSIFASLKVDHP